MEKPYKTHEVKLHVNHAMQAFEAVCSCYQNLRGQGGLDFDGQKAWQPVKKLLSEIDREIEPTLSPRQFAVSQELLDIKEEGDSPQDERGRCKNLDQHCLFMTADLLLSKERSFRKFCQLALNIGQAQALSVEPQTWFDGNLYFDDETFKYLDEFLLRNKYLDKIQKVLEEVTENFSAK